MKVTKTSNSSNAKFLIDRGPKPNLVLIDKKLASYGMTFDDKLFKKSVLAMKRMSAKEMELLLSGAPPEFDSFAAPLIAAISLAAR